MINAVNIMLLILFIGTQYFKGKLCVRIGKKKVEQSGP